MACLLFFVPITSSVDAQDWYLPRERELISDRRLELGTRLSFNTNESRSITNRASSLTPSLRWSPVNYLEIYSEIPLSSVSENRVLDIDGDTELESITFREDNPGDWLTQIKYVPFGRADRQIGLNLDIVLPTGKNPYENIIATGSGHFQVVPGISYSQILDPVNLYGYVGYRRALAEDYGGSRYRLGDSLRLRWGATIQVNPSMNLSLFGSGGFTQPSEKDGTIRPGTKSNTIQMGNGLGIILNQSTRLKMNTVYGMSSSATDFVISVGLTHQIY